MTFEVDSCKKFLGKRSKFSSFSGMEHFNAGSLDVPEPDVREKSSSHHNLDKVQVERREKNSLLTPRNSSGSTDVVSYDVHIFYYPWYGSKKFDGAYLHWNHKYLENWNKNGAKRYPQGEHDPDRDDIAASFFPRLGAYSSRDPAVISDHMRQLQRSGAGVLVLSWYPPGLSDENGLPSDDCVLPLLDAAQQHGLKLALMVEPYQNLTAETFRQHLVYALNQYGSHPAFYRRPVNRTRQLPVFYLYDSYRVPGEEWQRLFSRRGDLSVRDTRLDALFFGLLTELRDRAHVKRAKFDGFFTYFAANGFTYGSSWKNWKSLHDFAVRQSLLFAPSVGPGYDDTRVRPWNVGNMRQRHDGEYYDRSWRTALAARAPIVTITSFNEWHEGTQIEEAVPKETADKSFRYADYRPLLQSYYLDKTREWVKKFQDDDTSYEAFRN